MKRIIKELIYSAIRANDTTGTWYRVLKVSEGLRWAICAAWMDYDDDGNNVVHAKIAYQPVNSLMQCDYDIDWIMPMVDGWVDDTEIRIGISVFDVTEEKIEYLAQEWDRIQREYIYNTKIA